VWKETNLHVVVVKIVELEINFNDFVGATCILSYQIGDFNFHFDMGKVELVARVSNRRTVSAELLINGTFLCACICGC
jgi:hypothetical protein